MKGIQVCSNKEPFNSQKEDMNFFLRWAMWPMGLLLGWYYRKLSCLFLNNICITSVKKLMLIYFLDSLDIFRKNIVFSSSHSRRSFSKLDLFFNRRKNLYLHQTSYVILFPLRNPVHADILLIRCIRYIYGFPLFVPLYRGVSFTEIPQFILHLSHHLR